MANQIKAPINYPIIAGGKIVSGGTVLFGQPNVKPDEDNPATLKAVYLDAGLTQQAENPQGISSDGVFDQADTGILYGSDNTVYSIVIRGANKKELSYIPEYDLNDANAAAAAQESASQAAASESNAIAAKNLTEALYTDFTNRYFGAYSADPSVDDLGNPPSEGSVYFNTVSDVFYTWDGSAWMDYFPSNPNGLMVTATGTTTTRSLAKRFSDEISPKDFGAICDGVANDTDAVRKVHELANITGASVVYKGITSIAIDADAQIPINSNVDFNGCEIIVLNGIMATPTFSTFNTMFIVDDPNTPLETVSGAVTSTNLKTGSLTPTKGLFNGYGLAVLTCGFQIPDRSGTGTVDYEQSFCVVREGQATLPLSTDLSAFAGSVTVDYRKMSKKRVYIKNFSVSEEGWNNQILIKVQRNNVEIDGFTFSHENGAAFNNIQQLIQLSYCCNVSVKNVVASGQPVTLTNGSYVLEIDYCSEVRVDNFQSTWLGWPSTGTNHTNGLYYTNSTITRIDSHEGGHNTFVDNCTLSQRGVEYGWGGGQLKVTNSVVLFASIFKTRDDYGGQFFGSLIADNVEMEANNTSELVVMDIKAGATVPVYLPKTIIARNIHRRGIASGGGFAGKMSMRINRQGTSNVYSPYTVDLCNWTSEINNNFGGIFNYASFDRPPSLFRTTLKLSNMLGDKVPSDGEGFLIPAPTFTPANDVDVYIEVDKVNMLLIDARGSGVIAECDISNCDIVGCLIEPAPSPQPDIRASNCRFKYKPVGYAGNVPFGGTPSGSANRTAIDNCKVYPVGINLSSVSASQGTLLLTGAGATTDLPATVTADDMFNGYKASSQYE